MVLHLLICKIGEIRAVLELIIGQEPSLNWAKLQSIDD